VAYRGYLTLARGQRVMSVAHGGQVLLAAATAGLAGGQLPVGVTLRDLGEHHLKGLVAAEHLWQAESPDLAAVIMFWNSGRSSVVADLARSQNSCTIVIWLRSQNSCMARSCASMDSSRWLSDENRAYSTARGVIPRFRKRSI
jgi:hypothetical protein